MSEPDRDTLLETQRRRLRTRDVDERAATMVKRGRILGTVRTSIAKKAQVVGACMALGPDDHLSGSHRSHGHPATPNRRWRRTTRGPQTYADKLTRLGLPTPASAVVDPVITMTSWLMQRAPDAGVFVMCGEPACRALTAAAVRRTEPAGSSMWSRGRGQLRPGLGLPHAADRLRRAPATPARPPGDDEPGRVLPGRSRLREPDAAACTAPIEAVTGVRCEVNVGKPSPIMLDTALAVLGLRAGDCVMVRDRLQSNIAMALDVGTEGARMLTGDSTRNHVAALAVDRRPTFALERLDELLPPGRWQG